MNGPSFALPHITYFLTESGQVLCCRHCGAAVIPLLGLSATATQRRCTAFIEQHKDCKPDRDVNPQDYP